MNVPNKSKDLLFSGLTHPSATNSNVTSTKEAMVIPETGRFEVPIVPVKRPETMTNSNDKNKDKIEATTAIRIFPPEIKKPAKNPIIIPPNNISVPTDELSALFVDFALRVSFMEEIIVGINLIAPIKPPESIIPAPIYFT
ncbi:hypothetical protein DSECCO2_565920 [anaerobic digester metagenome]